MGPLLVSFLPLFYHIQNFVVQVRYSFFSKIQLFSFFVSNFFFFFFFFFFFDIARLKKDRKKLFDPFFRILVTREKTKIFLQQIADLHICTYLYSSPFLLFILAQPILHKITNFHILFLFGADSGVDSFRVIGAINEYHNDSKIRVAKLPNAQYLETQKIAVHCKEGQQSLRPLISLSKFIGFPESFSVFFLM